MCIVKRESASKRDGILFMLRLGAGLRTSDLVTHAQLEIRLQSPWRIITTALQQPCMAFHVFLTYSILYAERLPVQGD